MAGSAELDELIRRNAEAASALIGGDVRGYLALIEHADDYTLMPPYGGETVRGFEGSPEAIEGMERFFQGGEAEVEVVETYVSGGGDLAVLAVIERQHGRVAGFPDQDLSLRVTVVFRKEGGTWRLAHRHADPLTHGIPMSTMNALARGDAAS